MVFKRRELNGGEIDPAINTAGRIDGKREKPLTNRQLREREFLSLLRKVKPLLAPSVAVAFKIVQNDQSTDMNRLKASALIIGLYKELVADTYNQDYDTESGEELQPNTPKAPVFSLTMISNNDKKEE